MDTRKRRHERTDDDNERSVKPKTDRAAESAAETNSDTSYVSAAAAIFSDSDEAEEETGPSDVASDSDMSTSSDEPSSESDDSGADSEDDDVDMSSPGRSVSEEPINVRPGSKPNIVRGKTDAGLLKRLRRFMPRMEAANAELEQERGAGTLASRNMEVTDEDEAHIEMDLGLGVLESKPLGTAHEDEDVNSAPDSNGEQSDVLDKLMGRDEAPHKSSCHIEVVEEA